MTTPPRRKKLIEVALPLEAINKASAREKSIRHGHPSTLHLWWARRPLAACRAVLFSSFVDDPESDPRYRNPDGTVDEDAAAEKRAQLFDLIEQLVQWENSNNEVIINRARGEIARCIASRKVETGELKRDQALELELPEPEWTGKPPRIITARAGDFEVFRLDTDGKTMVPSATPDQVNAFLLSHAPPVLDPFCGGGSIPLEAQRLGLRAFGSDLNPVPVLITKALIEIPPKFAGMPPVHPEALAAGPGGGKKKGKARASKGQATLDTQAWRGAEGLAADVRAYGKWMRDEAEKRIGHLYPKVRVTAEMAKDRPDLEQYIGQELTVIAWLWARTVPSPNPATENAPVPLVRSFWLSTKRGKQAWVEPVVSPDNTVQFRVASGPPNAHFDPTQGTVTRSGATCLITRQPIPLRHIRDEARAGRMKMRLMAIVAKGERERVYLSPTPAHEAAAKIDLPRNIPETSLPEQALGFRVQLYGMSKHYQLFSARQLTALTTISDLVMEARTRIVADVTAARCTACTTGCTCAGASGDSAYADAVATHLGLIVSKATTFHNTLARWRAKEGKSAPAFGRQTISMVWDTAEVNPFAGAGGDFDGVVDGASRAIVRLPAEPTGSANQADAALTRPGCRPTTSTDPPYYDNIGYADLSDFSYVWLRRSLATLYPALFGTLLTPKADELIAAPFRHAGSREAANQYFESGLRRTFEQLVSVQDEDYPMSIYYAFKQAEDDDRVVASTGWETMLEGLTGAGVQVTGTMPMRTEGATRMRGLGANALASSIVLACHQRSTSAPTASRRDFVARLKHQLPLALQDLQSGSIAPVDLAQAAIGPGMAVYSSYHRVLEPDGSRMGVRAALALINQVLDEMLSEQDADYDPDTRWAVKWFEQYGVADGPYGDAETLSTAVGVSVRGIEDAGIGKGGGGRVRLYKRDELDPHWSLESDARLTVWEVCQYLIKTLADEGQDAAADLLRRTREHPVGAAMIDPARELAYRLYTVCERNKWAKEALGYNSLVVAWPDIDRLSREAPSRPQPVQSEMFSGGA